MSNTPEAQEQREMTLNEEKEKKQDSDIKKAKLYYTISGGTGGSTWAEFYWFCPKCNLETTHFPCYSIPYRDDWDYNEKVLNKIHKCRACGQEYRVDNDAIHKWGQLESESLSTALAFIGSALFFGFLLLWALCSKG